ncbi:MAG TPA: hypothetical protein VGR00_04800 [Thermoanaerobaculia bacterium]|nr:hypothetical protein [Thermoanaerobaculia bacterium]
MPYQENALDAALARAVATHDGILFRLAYPKRAGERRREEARLLRAAAEVKRLLAQGADAAFLDDDARSGIAGTTIRTAFSYEMARWLARKFPSRVSIDDVNNAAPDRLAALLPAFVPLLREDALAEANVPYGTWFEAAAGRGPKALGWLLGRVAEIGGDAREKAERFDALGLDLRLDVGDALLSRTRTRLPSRKSFAFDALLTRKDVSLESALAGPRLSVRALSRREGERAIDDARGAMAVRYRELYGFTFADEATAVVADAGRGTEIFLFGLPPLRRLPLRAAYAFLLVTNGVPVGYGEGFVLFERLELSFNVFPAFRGGETAYLLSRVMKLFARRLGSRVFSLDPYQIGKGNEEAIAAGAFWFYRKLGFRPTDAGVTRLLRREEEKLAADSSYRTPSRTLRRLAEAPLLYSGPEEGAAWERFRIRQLGLRGARRDGATERVARAAGLDAGRLTPAEREAFQGLAPVIDLIPTRSRPGLAGLVELVRAKAGRSEDAYVRLLLDASDLRAALLRAG